MTSDFSQKLGLSDLLNEDLSSYEYFQGLPQDIQQAAESEDIGSFEELQRYVEKKRKEEHIYEH